MPQPTYLKSTWDLLKNRHHISYMIKFKGWSSFLWLNVPFKKASHATFCICCGMIVRCASYMQSIRLVIFMSESCECLLTNTRFKVALSLLTLNAQPYLWIPYCPTLLDGYSSSTSYCKFMVLFFYSMRLALRLVGHFFCYYVIASQYFWNDIGWCWYNKTCQCLSVHFLIWQKNFLKTNRIRSF